MERYSKVTGNEMGEGMHEWQHFSRWICLLIFWILSLLEAPRTKEFLFAFPAFIQNYDFFFSNFCREEESVEVNRAGKAARFRAGHWASSLNQIACEHTKILVIKKQLLFFISRIWNHPVEEKFTKTDHEEGCKSWLSIIKQT